MVSTNQSEFLAVAQEIADLIKQLQRNQNAGGVHKVSQVTLSHESLSMCQGKQNTLVHILTYLFLTSLIAEAK